MSSQGFDPKDLEEICARKPRDVRMKKTDFKELGRNVLLGSIDVAVDSVKTASVVISMAEKKPKLMSLLTTCNTHGKIALMNRKTAIFNRFFSVET
ncbi:hypothetical protein ACXV6R_004104 [Yersinia enterocolitica]